MISKDENASWKSKDENARWSSIRSVCSKIKKTVRKECFDTFGFQTIFSFVGACSFFITFYFFNNAKPRS